MLFFGTEAFSATILQRLLDAGFPIDAVVTQPDKPSGRGHKVTPSPVKVLALDRNIRVLQPEKVGDIADDIKSYGKPAAVLASYGKIIPQSILDLFEPGIINVHPSLLPQYRGPSPIETALLDDVETGVSIMKLTAKMDAGPVYAQRNVEKRDTINGLTQELADVSSNLLIEILPAILDGSLQPKEQTGEPTYTKKIMKDDGRIDWGKPAEELVRQIQAYAVWPQSRTTFGSLDVIITEATALPTGPGNPGEVQVVDDFLFVGTSDGTLRVNRLKPLGKKEMPVKAFLQGYRSQL